MKLTISWALLFLFNIYSLSLRAQDDCSADKSKEYNAKLGRCVSKRSSIDTNNAFKSCTAISDETQRSDCLKELAKNEVGENSKAEQSGPSDMTGASINVVFSGTVLVSSLLSGEKGSITNCYGKMIAIGTGTAGVAAQQYFIHSSKKDIEEIQQKFKDAQSEDDYQTQMDAFKFLKEEQEAIVKMAETRRNSYYVISAGYAVAAATSLLSDADKAVCTGDTKNASDSAAIDKEADPLEGVVDADNPSVAPDPALEKGVKKVKKNFGQMLSSPAGVAVISTAAAGWNLYLADAAGEQIEKAEANVEAIDKIITKFEDTIAGSCPKGRDSYTQGRCYCYKSDGSKNTAHSRSETCKSLWAKDDRNLYAKSSDKTFTGEQKDQKGCLTKDQQFDEKCKCRKFIDEGGQNACYKSGFSSGSVAALNSGLSNQAISDNLDGLTGGNTNNLNLNGEELGKLARSSNNKLKKLIKRLGANKPNNQFSDRALDNKLFASLAKKLAASAPAYTAKLASTNGAGFNATPSSSTTSNNALAKARGSLKEVKYSKGKSLSGSKNRKSKRFMFGRDSGSSRKVKKFSSNKKYNYKNNDIVMRKDLSLWKVISNRYNNTGLRRLFSE